MYFSVLSREAQEEFCRTFFDLFSGRLESYAIRTDSGAYLPSTYDGDNENTKRVVEATVKQCGSPEFTEQAVRAHLRGDAFLGVYPISADSTVRWFALDFDKKKDTDPDPYAAALAQAMVFYKEAKLPVYIERSQSGNGYHIWGFLEGQVNAGKLRHALAPLLLRADTYDRMFPNQDSVSETRPLGNLIALPLQGKRVPEGGSVFVRQNDGKPVVIEDQFEFLSAVKRIPLSRIDELYEEAGEYQAEADVKPRDVPPESLPNAWKLAHPVYGCEWIRHCWDNAADLDEPQWYALACQFAQLQGGRELFHEFSAQDPRRYSVKATDKKFDQALKQNKPHTCQAIRDLGGTCTCDMRFPSDVRHPFDLAKVSFLRLVESLENRPSDDTSTVLSGADGYAHLIDWLEEIQRDPTMGAGYKYGIPGIDAATGIRDSDLVVIAARPGMGKTALMWTLVNNLCEEKVPAYVFSAEMTALQGFKRLASIRSGVTQDAMTLGKMTKQDWEDIREAQRLVSNPDLYPLYVDDRSRSLSRIFEVSAMLVNQYGKGPIVIDYLQLLQRNPGESMFDHVTRITLGLKLLAKSLDVPVVVLAQLNRTADDATAETQTSDSMLRGSGEIETTADVILFLLGEKGPGVAERTLVLHKERHREANIRVPLQFYKSLMLFADAGTWDTAIPTHTSATEDFDESKVYMGCI